MNDTYTSPGKATIPARARRPSLLVLGEYLQKKDSGNLFSSPANKMLRAWLREADFADAELVFDNVFNIEPIRHGPKFLPFFGPKPSAQPHLRMVRKSNYLQREHYPLLEQFWSRTNALAPNLILAMGEISLWATTSETSLRASRGRITTTHAAFPGPLKVLPVHSVMDVIREWPLRPILLADLRKARRESLFPEIRRPKREIWIEPTIEDLETFWQLHLRHADHYFCDIENKPQGITCFGVAPGPEIALVVPFYDTRKKDKNYWRTAREERIAWKFVHRVSNNPNACSIGQNYQHDMQYLYRTGIPVRNFGGDTMLMAHSIQPEFQKGLGFLASIHSDELAWKHMGKTSARAAKKEDQ